MTTDQFGKAVVTLGLMEVDELKGWWNALPLGSRPQDGQAMAKLLVADGKITQHQSQEIFAGRASQIALGEYIVLDKIGAGGMGQVFKARHRTMQRTVAIKLLPQSVSKNEASIKRFQREVQAAARLEHPNIVTAYDAGRSGGHPFLVMQYVDGSDLAAILQQVGPLSIDLALNYTLQAARGLAYAHSEGVVHRDIKPANLLLDKKGTVKILDMGLARVDDPALSDSKDGLTQSGQVMGTVDYMAPEQAFDTRRADARSDIYSLGCTLFRLLTGGNLYAGDSLLQKMLAHREEPIPSLCDRRPDVPAEVDALFQRMVTKHPDERIQTMGEVVAELEVLCGVATTKPSGASTNTRLAELLGDAIKDFPTRGHSRGGKTTGPSSARDSATVAFSRSDHGTDPNSVSLGSDSAGRQLFGDTSQSGTARARRAAAGQPPIPIKWLVVAAGALAVLLLLAIIWKSFKSDGEEVKPASGNDAPSVNAKPEEEKMFDLPATQPAAQPIGNTRPVQNNPPTISTAPVANTSGNTGGEYALSFSNAADQVVFNGMNLAANPPLTIECWITPDVFPRGEAAIWTLGTFPGTRLTLKFYADDLQFMYSNTQLNAWRQVTAGKGSLPVGRPSHVSATWDGKFLELSVNGSAPKMNSISNDLTSLRPAGRLQLGSQSDTKSGSISSFQGNISELRISNTIRYKSAFTPSNRFELDPYTLALYHFDDWGGQTLKDSSGFDYQGAIQGPKWMRAAAPPAATPSMGGNSTSSTSSTSSVPSIQQSKPAPPAPAAPTPPPVSVTPGFMSLFDGRSIVGWRDKNGGLGSWMIQDGELTCASGQRTFLITNREDFDDFHLRVEAKINDGGNSGVFFRCRDTGASSPLGFEAQINSTNVDPQRTGSLFNLVDVKEMLVPPDTWFEMEVICQGPRIRILVNGKQTAELVDNAKRFQRGAIALQHFEGGRRVYFRKIEIKSLPPQ